MLFGANLLHLVTSAKRGCIACHLQLFSQYIKQIIALLAGATASTDNC
jgi:hypothetical protein